MTLPALLPDLFQELVVPHTGFQQSPLKFADSDVSHIDEAWGITFWPH